MYPLEAPDRWFWQEDALPPVAFCVWALISDGLTVPPFDRHGVGNGNLLAAGLDEPTWREWLVSLVSQHAAAAEIARTFTVSPGGGTFRRAGLNEDLVRAPGALCPGSPALRDLLNALWSEYLPLGEAWKRRVSPNKLAPTLQRRLWDALKPFHGNLPTLSVFLVDYPEPAVLTLPPTTCLVAPSPDPQRYADQVVEAAASLAAASDATE